MAKDKTNGNEKKERKGDPNIKTVALKMNLDEHKRLFDFCDKSGFVPAKFILAATELHIQRMEKVLFPNEVIIPECPTIETPETPA